MTRRPLVSLFSYRTDIAGGEKTATSQSNSAMKHYSDSPFITAVNETRPPPKGSTRSRGPD